MYINTFLGLADEGKLLYVHVLTGTALLYMYMQAYKKRCVFITQAGYLQFFQGETHLALLRVN